MKDVILLKTNWSSDYWKTDKEAPYPKREYTLIKDWEILESSCPLPGLGLYIKGKHEDFREVQFSYIIIKGIRFDVETLQPYFDLKTISESHTSSSKFISQLPLFDLFGSFDFNVVKKILDHLEENPPEEWLFVAGESKNVIVKESESHQTVRDLENQLIGKYFLDILNLALSNDDFEDRIMSLFRAIGFLVLQKGHTLPGSYADGFFSFEDYAIVYDCKNSISFGLNQETKRAIDQYLRDEKKIRKEPYIYPAIIAKSFTSESGGDIPFISVQCLFHLLMKRLIMGPTFTLSPLKKILDNKTPLTVDLIDKEWRY